MALGVALALRYIRGTATRRPVGGFIHGLTGAVGLGLLIFALQGPRRGDAMGVGSFGLVAAALFGLALTIGPLVPLLTHRSPRMAGLIIAAHASLAITAFVLFLAWASV